MSRRPRVTDDDVDMGLQDALDREYTQAQHDDDRRWREYLDQVEYKLASGHPNPWGFRGGGLLPRKKETT